MAGVPVDVPVELLSLLWHRHPIGYLDFRLGKGGYIRHPVDIGSVVAGGLPELVLMSE